VVQLFFLPPAAQETDSVIVGWQFAAVDVAQSSHSPLLLLLVTTAFLVVVVEAAVVVDALQSTHVLPPVVVGALTGDVVDAVVVVMGLPKGTHVLLR
jgi:hypothetical protein